jgi:hypothetical protein
MWRRDEWDIQKDEDGIIVRATALHISFTMNVINEDYKLQVLFKWWSFTCVLPLIIPHACGWVGAGWVCGCVGGWVGGLVGALVGGGCVGGWAGSLIGASSLIGVLVVGLPELG